MNVNYLQLARSFTLGGIIVASVKYITKYLSSKYAAIVWSFPLSIIPSIMFMYIDGRKSKDIIDQTKDYAIYFPTLLIFLWVMSYTINKFGKYRGGIYYAMAITLTIWGICCVILFNLIPLFKKKDENISQE